MINLLILFTLHAHADLSSRYRELGAQINVLTRRPLVYQVRDCLLDILTNKPLPGTVVEVESAQLQKSVYTTLDKYGCLNFNAEVDGTARDCTQLTTFRVRVGGEIALEQRVAANAKRGHAILASDSYPPRGLTGLELWIASLHGKQLCPDQ